MRIHQLPKVKVTSERAFDTDKLMLVALTNIMDVVKGKEVKLPNMIIGNLHCDDSLLVCKPNLTFPKRQQKISDLKVPIAPDDFMVAYWAVRMSVDPSDINMVFGIKESTIKVGTDIYHIKVPTMTNIKNIKVGDELRVQKAKVDEPREKAEPDPKRQKVEPKAKGKGTREGKGKA